jgi:hypothetical protein
LKVFLSAGSPFFKKNLYLFQQNLPGRRMREQGTIVIEYNVQASQGVIQTVVP